MKRMDKKGIEEKYIITLILGIFGLAILMYFYTQFSWTTLTDKEICHESVVYRGTLNAGIFEPGREHIPLKCKTENICLDESNKECVNVFGKKTDKNKITKIKIKDKTDVEEVFSDALVECHSIFGEGKLNFMPTSIKTENYCIICSRIVLDKKENSKINNLSFLELYKYMEKKKNSEGKTYLEYVYRDIGNNADDILNKVISNSDNKFKKEDLKIDLSSEYGNVVIVSITKNGNFWTGLGAGSVGGVVGGVLLLIPYIGPLAAVTVGGGTSIFIFSKFNKNGEFYYSPPVIVSYDSEALNQLKCTKLEGAS